MNRCMLASVEAAGATVRPRYSFKRVEKGGKMEVGASWLRASQYGIEGLMPASCLFVRCHLGQLTLHVHVKLTGQGHVSMLLPL